MWWLFEKQLETESAVEYRYSTGCDALDGLVRYDKSNDETICVTPCSQDTSSFAQQYAADKLYFLRRKGFPERYQVACG